MIDLLDDVSEYAAFVMDHDMLGWDNFLEGRVSCKLIALQWTTCAAHSFTCLFGHGAHNSLSIFLTSPIGNDSTIMNGYI
jgi:hypothetical protein